MEFLYKLYSNNYFGIGLFIVITVLTFSFLVVLFFGKKDQKEREASINQENVNNNSNIEQKPDLEAVSISNTNLSDTNANNIPTESNITTDINNNENTNYNNLNENINTKEDSINNNINIDDVFKKVEETKLNTENNENVFDINSLSNNVLNQEEPVNNNIAVNDFEEKVITPEIKANLFKVEEPIKEESNNNVFKYPFEEEKKVAPSQFSSVYLSGEEKIVTEETKSNIDLPKKVELPKLNKKTTNNMFNSNFSDEGNKNSTSMFNIEK